MTTRERTAERNHAETQHWEDPAQPAESEARESGDAFLSAADAAIERALSGRSDAFLAQNRQLGGQ